MKDSDKYKSSRLLLLKLLRKNVLLSKFVSNKPRERLKSVLVSKSRSESGRSKSSKDLKLSVNVRWLSVLESKD